MSENNYRPGGKDYVYVNDQRILKMDKAYIEKLKQEAKKKIIID